MYLKDSYFRKGKKRLLHRSLHRKEEPKTKSKRKNNKHNYIRMNAILLSETP